MEVEAGARAHVPHPLRPYEPLIVNAALRLAERMAERGIRLAGRRLATPLEARRRLGLAL